jgi:hypothetical protein
VANPQDPRYSAIVGSLNANQNKTPAVQAKAIQDALRGMEQPTQPVADLLWKVLVFALASVAVLSLLGLVVLIAVGKTPDLVLTAFTASVTGLVGLFVPAPGGGRWAG